jgi:hypothetical protein
LRRTTLAWIVAADVAIAAACGLLAGLGPRREEGPRTVAEKRAEAADVGGPFPLELRSPQIVAGTSQRVLVSLRRPSLGELGARRRLRPAAQRAYVRSLNREARALMSALTAKGVTFGRPVLFARVWSGFAATIATKDLPAVQALGLRVEPVRRFYPAAVPADDAPPVRPLPARSAAETVAILDSQPLPDRRVGARLQTVARIAPTHRRGRLSPAELSGPVLAQVVAGELPRARLLAIRVAGSQALENGRFQVYGTTDQLLAGIERAVDPDGDGDSADAVAVAVTGLSAPYSGFAGSPEAAGADAALELGTVMVAPAGNGGESGGPFGTIASPGAGSGALTAAALDDSGDPAPASAAGPTYAFGPKPDLAISGGASTQLGARWGTGVAAARIAGVAAALRAARPELRARDAAAAIVGTADPRGSLFEAGGGDPLLQAARGTPVAAEPWSLVLRPGAAATVELRNLSAKAISYAPKLDADPGVKLSPARVSIRPRGVARLRVETPAKAPPGSGRIVVGPIAIPFALLPGEPPRPPIGRMRIVTSRGKPRGVRFTAGSIDRGDDGASVIPVGNLVLAIAGPARRELTPPGGARDLLPAAYAYTLTPEVRRKLPPGRYRFVVRARGTAGGPAVVRRSAAFSIR